MSKTTFLRRILPLVLCTASLLTSVGCSANRNAFPPAVSTPNTFTIPGKVPGKLPAEKPTEKPTEAPKPSTEAPKPPTEKPTEPTEPALTADYAGYLDRLQYIQKKSSAFGDATGFLWDWDSDGVEELFVSYWCWNDRYETAENLFAIYDTVNGKLVTVAEDDSYGHYAAENLGGFAGITKLGDEPMVVTFLAKSKPYYSENGISYTGTYVMRIDNLKNRSLISKTTVTWDGMVASYVLNTFPLEEKDYLAEVARFSNLIPHLHQEGIFIRMEYTQPSETLDALVRIVRAKAG